MSASAALGNYVRMYVCSYYESPIFVFLPENPIQLLCQHYSFFMENLQPTTVSRIMEQENLLSSADLDVILNAPMDYMRNLYIFEHVRHMVTPDLFRFLDILQKIDSQKYVSDELTEGTYVQYVCVCTHVQGCAQVKESAVDT